MELLVLVLLGGLLFILVGAIMGMVAASRATDLRRRLEEQERLLNDLHRQIQRLERQTVDHPAPRTVTAAAVAAAPAPPPATPRPAPEPPSLATTPVPVPSGAEPVQRTVAPVASAPSGMEGAPSEMRVATAKEIVVPAPVVVAPPVVAVVTESRPSITRPPPPSVPTAPPSIAPVAAAPADDQEGISGVEAAVGMRWLTWAGVGMLFLGLAFFLKYAYDQDWLGRVFTPPMRIATVVVVATAMVVLGWRQWRTGASALGQGLMGGGQALLYLAVYAAFQPALMVVREPLIGATGAFLLMALVTAAGLGFAAGIDALAMAVVAVVGGFAAPVLVSTGQDAQHALFAYLLLLDLGVLGVALFRRWRWLDVAAFAGTALLFAGWFATWYRHHLPHPDLATLLWLGVFHAVFLMLPFAHHWRLRTPVTLERFALALANLAWSLGYAAYMLQSDDQLLLALICLVMAGTYCWLGGLTHRRCGGDARTRHGFTALATMLLTLGLFYLLPVDGITTAWFAEAAILLHLGWRFAYAPTRWMALAVLTLAMGRTLFLHLPHPDPDAVFIANRWFLIELVAAVGCAAFALIHARHRAIGAERGVALGVGVVAGLWLLLAGALEIDRHASSHREAWQAVLPAQAIAWWSLTLAAAFLHWAGRWRERMVLYASLLPCAVAVIAAAIAYDDYAVDAWLALNGWALTGLAAGLMVVHAARTAWFRCDDARLGSVLAGMAQLLFVGLLTVECMAWIQRAPHEAGVPDRVLAWVWILSSLASSLVALAWRSRRILIIGFLPLVAGLVVVLALYERRWPDQVLVANSRFLLGLLAAAGIAWYGLVRRRLAGDGPAPVTARFAQPFALAYALLIVTCEAVAWSGVHHRHTGLSAAWTVLLLGYGWLAGAAIGWWRHHHTGDRGVLAVGGVALTGVLVMTLALFGQGWPAAWMFLNLRFLLAVLGTAMMVRYALRSPHRTMLAWVAYGFGLLALTCEPPTWLLANIADRPEARKAALFSVTVVWILAAVASLTVGFRRDRRLLRFTALGLFALTAAKLLLLDMSGAQQIYRILAFIVVGAVFVAASWFYHRAERRMTVRR